MIRPTKAPGKRLEYLGFNTTARRNGGRFFKNPQQ